MPRTAIARDEPSPRPTATAPVGAGLPPGGVVRGCHEGLRGHMTRRDALLAEAEGAGIDRAGHRPSWGRGEAA